MKLSMKKIAGVFGVAGLMSVAGMANAATATANFQVTATVVASCVVKADPLAFGSVTPSETGPAVTKQSNVKITCSNGSGYNVTLGDGLNIDAGKTQRSMKAAGADLLKYDLFTTTARDVKWIGSQQVPGTGSGVEQTVVVYGSLPVNQFVTAGDYADTVTVTVTY